MLPAAAPDFTRPYNVALGLCEDYPRDADLAVAERDFALLASMNLHTLRISVAWSGCEPEKGLYEWDRLDRLIETASSRYGLSLLAYICYAPAWATGGDWKAPPLDAADFARFAGAAAARYRGGVRCWELWNEPDNQDFWIGTPAEYVRMAAAGARAIKEADPGALICLGGLAQSHRADYLADLYRLGAGNFTDVINVHGYFETWNGLPLTDLPACLERIAAVIRANGNRQQLWVEEIGYSNYVEPDGRVSEWYRAQYPYEHTPAYQAVYLIKALALLLATRLVGAIGWYEVKDLPLSQAAIGDVNNHFLGVIDAERRPKPALFALGLMSDLFRGEYEPVSPERLGARRIMTGKAHELLFAMADGALTYLAWPAGGAGAELELALPSGWQAAAFSPLGDKRTLPAVDGKILLRLRPDELAILRFYPHRLPALLNLIPIPGGAVLSGDGTTQAAVRLVNAGGTAAEDCRVDLVWPGGVIPVGSTPGLDGGRELDLRLALPASALAGEPSGMPGAYLVARCREGILAASPLTEPVKVRS